MWAIGNGESRKHIKLENLYGIKIGCNAIARDHKVDHLVCVDRRMVNEIILLGVNKHTLIHTRKEWKDHFVDQENILEVPTLPYTGTYRWDQPFQWGSGPYAILIAALNTKDSKVNLIGFDLYSKTNLVNNIYKGTINYDSPDKKFIDPSFWIQQTKMIFICFPKIQFVIYQDDSWQLPKLWKLDNVSLDNINKIS